MIQLNKQFRMEGREILTPKDFCNYYSPADLLRYRKMAAGFVRHRMAGLSPWHGYHAEMLYKAVYQWDILMEEKETFKAIYGLPETEAVNMAEFYPDVPGIWRRIKNNGKWLSSECYALENIMKETGKAEYGTVLNSIWECVREMELERQDREQAFLILSAGHFLSGKVMGESAKCSFSVKELQLAFQGEMDEKTAEPEQAADGFVFKASPIPYELKQSEIKSTGFILHTIEVKKITAVQAADGATNIPVKLHLGGETVEIMPGDYRYASFVNGEWLRIFPIRKEHDGVTMERKGNMIYVTCEGQEIKIDCTERNLLDFDADSQGNYILLEPGYADYSHFSQRYEVIEQLPSQNIVEVSIRQDQVYVLDRKGSVFKNGVQQGSYPTSLMYCS